MAIITKGITGGISGKIGQVVGLRLTGKEVIRAVPKCEKLNSKSLLRQNGKNLAVCVDMWPHLKQAIQAIRSRYAHPIEYTYNQYIKSAIAHSAFEQPEYINSMWFGTDAFKSKLCFCGTQYQNNANTELTYINGHSIKAMHPNTKLYLVTYRTHNDFFFQSIITNYNNFFRLTNSVSGNPSGSYITNVMFMLNSSTQEYSQFGIAIKRVP